MPIEDYYIDLDLSDAPPARFKYPVGNRVPLRETSDGNKNDTSYWSAVSASTIPHKVGVASSVYTDRILRAYDSKDNFDNVDPSFDPVEVWKTNKHKPEEFEQIGAMKNWEQYSFYTTMKEYEEKNLERIENSGLTGNAAAFVAQLATDPTTYAGFGAAKMLSKGMAARNAYALSGVAAGAAYEGLQQVADVNESRSAAESLTTIAAAGVMGSVLGSAVDTWVSRKAAGALKATEGKDFHQSSMQYIDDAVTIEQRAKSAGAAAVEKDPELSKILGRPAQTVAYGLRRIAPRLLGQTASEDLSRTTAEKFFGRSLKTQGDEAGVPRIMSVRDNLDTDTALYKGRIQKSYNEFRQFKQSGRMITDDDTKQAILRVADTTDTLADDSASSLVAKSHRSFFDTIANELKNVAGFNYRQGYVPMILSRNLIVKDFNAFKDKFVPMFLRAKAGLSDDMTELSNRMTSMVRNKASAKELEDLQEEINQVRAMMEESDADSIANATIYASKFASGEIGEHSTLSPFYSKVLPSRFKERLLDIREFADFIDTDPLKLQDMYMREVMPFLASHKTYGSRTPLKEIDVYKQQLQEKIAEALSKGDKKLAAKLEREKLDISEAITKGWDDMTAATTVRAGTLLGSNVMNIITAARNWVAATSLGGVVLSSLVEPVAMTLTHGFKKLPGFTRLLGQMATSPEMRQFVGKDAEYLSHAFSTGVHYHLMNNFADEMLNREIAGSGITAKLARGSRAINNGSQILNGNVPFTAVVRSAFAVAQQGIMKESLSQLIDGSIASARKTDLAFLGISTKAQARKILKYAQKYGEEKQGNFVFNLEKWGNENTFNVNQEKALTYMKSNFNDQLKRQLALIDWLEVEGKKRVAAGSKAAMHQKDDADRALARLIDEDTASLPNVVKDALSKEFALDQETGEQLNALTDTIRGTHIFNLRKVRDDFAMDAKKEIRDYLSKNVDTEALEARRLIEVALTRDNLRTSQNPGVGDTPHLFHVPGANLFTQFKSWGVMATHNYGISALQRNDAEHFMNITAYVGLSAAAYMLAEVARGNPPPTDIDEIVYSAVTNSGLVGGLPDYGGHYLMNTLFDLESGGAKFAERQDLQSTFLGPIGTKLQDIQGSIIRPIGQAIDPNKDVEFDDTWAKNMLDILPIPFMKPLIKNELLTED